jgi:hypothetical protein
LLIFDGVLGWTERHINNRKSTIINLTTSEPWEMRQESPSVTPASPVLRLAEKKWPIDD